MPMTIDEKRAAVELLLKSRGSGAEMSLMLRLVPDLDEEDTRAAVLNAVRGMRAAGHLDHVGVEEIVHRLSGAALVLVLGTGMSEVAGEVAHRLAREIEAELNAQKP
jgi:hypothetical protein